MALNQCCRIATNWYAFNNIWIKSALCQKANFSQFRNFMVENIYKCFTYNFSFLFGILYAFEAL